MAEIDRRSNRKDYQANFRPAEKERTKLRFNAVLTRDQQAIRQLRSAPVVNVTLGTESIAGIIQARDESRLQ
jgi:hypothetical protein